MKYILQLLLIGLLGCEVNSRNPENDEVLIERTGVEGLLETLADSVILVGLRTPDSVYFGPSEKIKVIDDLIFLMDSDHTQSITVYNLEGNYITQLKQAGEGPDEYQSLDAFSYRDSCIYIHSRGVGIKGYAFPSLKPIYSSSDKQTYSDFEPLGSINWITISDSPDTNGDYIGYEVKDAQFKRIKILKELGSLPLSIEFASAWPFYKDGEDLYTITHNAENVIYKMNNKGELSNFKKINFGKNSLPEEMWKDFDFMKLAEEMNKNNKSIIPHLFLKNENNMSFWFRNGGIYKSNLAVVSNRGENIHVYSDIKSALVNGSLPSPIGYYETFYITQVNAENLNANNRDNEFENEDTFLLFYKIK